MRIRWLLLLLGGLCGIAEAQDARIARPVVSIIIDDIGDRLAEGRQAVDLPFNISVSFLPHTPFARLLAERAHKRNKEVLLHLPMEAMNGKAMGPGGLSSEMQRHEFLGTLRQSIRAIPHVVGLNNHMGSLLTQRLQPMRWMMNELTWPRRLFFVDSKTTHSSVAMDIALQAGVKATTRDVFLDHEQDANFIHHQFDLMLAKARSKGAMLAIAHPFPLSLSILEQRLGELEEQEINLVNVSEFIDYNETRSRQWQASLSP